MFVWRAPPASLLRIWNYSGDLYAPYVTYAVPTNLTARTRAFGEGRDPYTGRRERLIGMSEWGETGRVRAATFTPSETSGIGDVYEPERKEKAF